MLCGLIQKDRLQPSTGVYQVQCLLSEAQAINSNVNIVPAAGGMKFSRNILVPDFCCNLSLDEIEQIFNAAVVFCAANRFNIQLLNGPQDF